TSWIGLWTIPGISTHTSVVPCPEVTPTAAAANDVTVNVLNGTGRRGLAQSVSRQMRARGFRVAKIGNDSALRNGTTAVVGDGRRGLPTARTVAARVHGKGAMVNDQRQPAVVDLILQPQFTTLNSTKVVAKMLAPPPVPSPQGCLPAAG